MVSGVFTIPLEKLRAAALRPASSEERPVIRINQFIGDDSNRLVRFAADAFLKNNSPRFFPLVFFGPTATGKTHLATGLAARWKHAHPQATLQASTGADFARAYARAVDTDAVADFRRRHTDIDCLVIDGLDELANKPAAQQELCLVIDRLGESEKRVLITSRQAPPEMSNLLPALASRLSAGLTVPFAAPGPAARHAIVKQLSKLHGLTLLDNVLELLAGCTTVDHGPLQTVPQLNHALVQLSAAADLQHEPITADAARKFLRLETRNSSLTLTKITAAVTKYFGVKVVDIRSPSRRQLIVRARGVAVYLARKLTDESLDAIGAEFGGRDHTTVLHAYRKTEALFTSDPIIQKAVDDLTRQLTQQ